MQNTRLSQHQRQLSSDNSATPNQNSRRSSANSSRQSAAQLSAALEQLTLNDSSNNSNCNSDSDSNEICNDPDCQQNYNNGGNCGSNGRNNNNNSNQHNNNNNNNEDGEVDQLEQQAHPSRITELELENSEECTLSVNEFLLETEMAAARANKDNLYAACSDASNGQQQQQQQSCTDANCTECNEQAAACGHIGLESEEDGEEPSTSTAARQNFYDPLLNRYGNERKFPFICLITKL